MQIKLFSKPVIFKGALVNIFVVFLYITNISFFLLSYFHVFFLPFYLGPLKKTVQSSSDFPQAQIWGDRVAEDFIALNLTHTETHETYMSQVKSDSSLAVVLNHICIVPGLHLVL